MSQLPRRQQNRLDREKRILDAALVTFAALGYSGTTMDAVAAEARLTKPTLYSYFPSKESLFQAMMLGKRDRMLDVFEHPSPDGMVQDLYTFAWDYADTVMRPDLLSLARLIIGEVQRFPEIGRAYQASGPDHLLRGIMRYLEERREAGQLAFDEAELAAQDLWGLILSAPRTQALYMPDSPPDRAALARYIHNGLRVFLKAYSAAAKADIEKLNALISAQPQQVGHDA
ncbi:TetR/AcrR family transcriptional regulator [Xinfangfangia sp. CPCC 101601]|uniref:TetR/AcrR family transcriptional regulator n=1 Tax=Pseudogemmobacter lacusdianii TaxID=3069608 RepID=A0ABU0VVJ3_9RHOB|nr:TetR/AcrR family transcriptional regulator [Xinfangfangia sp. CPCC 101601]MDQ2065260.1 TetR/AcrR family transcriptional regulator [Xinfangfangia sp. CPCC 101601]